MNQKTLIFIIIGVVVAAAALGGFMYFRQPAGPAPSATSTATPTPEKAFAPLSLAYSLKNYGPGGDSTITYYLENKKTCANREAYLGVVKIESKAVNSQTQYGKIVMFADNGQMAVTQSGNEESLAFDDLKSVFNEIDMPLLVNSLFVYAGKNFNSPEYWQSETPIILKDVVSGRDKGDYSIIRQEEDTAAAVPCTKFKIIAKTASMDGYFTACLAKQVGDAALPFVVYFKFQNDQGPSWQLKSVGSGKSGIAWSPQCLEPVTCVYVPQPSPAVRTQCEAQKGQIATDWDERNCIKGYRCASEADQAKENINRIQRPGCEINQAVLNKYLGCRRNNMPNFDGTKYDNSGCLLDIACRP